MSEFKSESEDVKGAFKEIFPLADEKDLPWSASQIKGFLRDRIRWEVEEGMFHFQSRVVKILCEISPPKTHIEDMCRIVVTEAEKYRQMVPALARAEAERDAWRAFALWIGEIIGIDVSQPQGRQSAINYIKSRVPPQNEPKEKKQ
jgi:hypothetical protein